MKIVHSMTFDSFFQISQLVSDVQHLQVTQSRLKESGANEVRDVYLHQG